MKIIFILALSTLILGSVASAISSHSDFVLTDRFDSRDDALNASESMAAKIKDGDHRKVRENISDYSCSLSTIDVKDVKLLESHVFNKSNELIPNYTGKISYVIDGCTSSKR